MGLNFSPPSYDDAVQTLRHALTAYGVSPKYHSTLEGPRITRHLFQIPTGTKIHQLVKLGPELTAYAESVSPITVHAPIPGTNLFALDVPRTDFEAFRPQELWAPSDAAVPLYMGKDAAGEAITLDLASCPHLLVSGATQSGKSVLMHSLLTGIVVNAPQVDLMLIDFKHVEFAVYAGASNLACPIVSEPEQAIDVLMNLQELMEARYCVLQRQGYVNILEYNAEHPDNIARPVVVVIDELADLMEGPLKNSAIPLLSSLLRKSRGAGIFFIVSTQHPAVRSIAGFIKANIPARVAFRTTSAVNSRVILDRTGAERLAGAGDGLMLTPATGQDPVRFQAPYITTDEIRKIVNREG